MTFAFFEFCFLQHNISIYIHKTDDVFLDPHALLKRKLSLLSLHFLVKIESKPVGLFGEFIQTYNIH